MLDTRLVVNSRLFVHSTAEARTSDPYEGPPAVVVDDERAAAVAQAGVHLASLVAGTEHLLVQLQHSQVRQSPPRPPLTWTRIFLSSCHRMQSSFLMIGTNTLCRMFVPVLPNVLSVLPQPATRPTLPVREMSGGGRQMGMMLSW